MAAATRDGGDFSGWGSKQGSKLKTWKTRFFVLRGTELAYFSGAGERGRLRVVDVDFAPDLPNGLLVRGEKKGKTQTLKMKTATADESKLWFAKLKHAVADEVGDAGGVHRTLSYRTRSASGLRAGSSIGAASAMVANAYPRQAQLPRQMSVYPAAAASVPTWTNAPPSQASSYEKSASEQRIRKKGWLLKEGKRMKSWKKRFMVLRGNVLSYYADETPSSPPLGSLVIRQVETNFTTPFTLDVHTQGGRILRIAADSLDDIEAWDLALSQAVSGDNQEMESRTTASLSSASSYDRLPSYENQSSAIEDSTFGDEYPPAKQRHGTLSSSASSQTCEGWLLKQGHKSKTWKRRYFTLNHDMLEYRHEPQDVPNEDEIIVDVDALNDDSIRIELDSGRTITVRAESHGEFVRWAVVLGELVGKPYAVEDAFRESEHQADASPVKTDPVKVSPALPPSIAKPEVKYGWLLKQGHLIRSWKQRYFVLHGDSLQYFENIDKPPRGSGVVVHVLRDAADPSCLDVHLANGRVLKISSDARDDLTSWYEVLQNASKLGAAEDKSHESQVEAVSLDNRLGQAGWLLKKGQNFKTWKNRYFVLERSRLLYYGDEGGELLGSGVVFEVSVGQARPFCIDVRFQNGRLLEVVAPDETQFAQWLKALQTSSNLTESFLSQHDEYPQENAVFDDEFDLDFADDGEHYEYDLDFDNQHDNDERARQDDSGYATWEAAMENKPEWDRSDSWNSALDDDVELESAESAEQSQASASGDTAVTMLADQSKCHGWLHKQGGTIKTWKRRYFSLHGTTLRYFKRETGSLLRSFTIARVKEQPDVALGLEVLTTSGRTLMLTAESKEDYGRWLRALQASISAECSALKSPTVQQQHDAGGRASNVSATVNNDGKVVASYSGWLEKEGQRFKTWKKRYFTYKKGALIYYGEVGGVAHGHGVVTSVRVDAAKPCTLCVSLEGDRVLRVSAASEDEMATWLRVLSSTLPSPVATSEQCLSAVSSPVGRDSAGPHVVGRGEARDQIASNRLDASDYLANDTISNESFVRINDGHADPSVRAQASFRTGQRSFKGDLSFNGAPEEHVADAHKNAVAHMESDDNLEYYRELMAENEAEQERRAGEKGASSVNGCAACCVVM